ncbi:MAG: hypothetical protein JJE37_05580 [Methyloceanibacter sp.]|jgi:hypothetical protein|nr:hypothetical protein [Methyloceanibacter sp.]
MNSDTHFFTVWTHRSAGSMFGAASNPVIRNGEYLCFENEERARAECDRLNAASGGSHVHYSIKPAHVLASAPSGLHSLASGFRWPSTEALARRSADPISPSAPPTELSARV